MCLLVLLLISIISVFIKISYSDTYNWKIWSQKCYVYQTAPSEAIPALEYLMLSAKSVIFDDFGRKQQNQNI